MMADAKPDAVVVIAFDETTKIIPALEAAGSARKDVQTYFVDGNTADYARARTTAAQRHAEGHQGHHSRRQGS